jgi:cold shock CspA family protein
MGRSPETSGKKDREKKRLQKRNDKEQKRQDRKSESKKGMGFDSMIGYVDEFGRLTDTPPSEQGKIAEVNLDDIVLGATMRLKENPEEALRKGTITFFNESKGYGFIRDAANGQSIFVHINAANYQMKENDKVTFEIVAGQKGPAAAQVKKA